ncbi:MAG TPA: four helix bundle protein [Luteitalea sp.]|nr:four helix bundle protein [Luteitalea sp.]
MATPLRERSTAFGVQVTEFVQVELKRRAIPFEILDQLLAAGTSIGAHCAEADSANSRRHLLVLRRGALREAKESQHWLTIIGQACRASSPSTVTALLKEANELVAILTTCVRRLGGDV